MKNKEQNKKKSKKRIVITPGEPAGIGPDIIIQLAQQDWPVELVVCASESLLHERAQQRGLPLTLREYNPQKAPCPQQASTLTILPIDLKRPVVSGELCVENSAYVLQTLSRACEGCLNGEFDALMTGPVHKGIINDAGIAFSGHTEFLAALSGKKHVVMMLSTENLRVALATTHLPLRDVPDALTRSTLRKTLNILHHDLQHYFGIPHPRIRVCGLNPHAGEGGHLGREEIEIITPVLDEMRTKGWQLSGPFPADTIFQPQYLDHADAVLAMYHDQGLPVLKYAGFGHAVNITLGLPFIRTSVDHGTALALAGTGMANPNSAIHALTMAITLSQCSL